MESWDKAPTYTAEYLVEEVDGQRTLRVRLEANRQSFFGNLLPPGGWNFSGDATATSVGKTPVCAIGTGENIAAIMSNSTSSISAPECMVHSNGSIWVDESAKILASLVQTVTKAWGASTTPAAGEGAAPIADPFANTSFPNGDACIGQEDPGQGNPITYENNQTNYLDPGVHCRPIIVKNPTKLILKPGEHVFRKDVTLMGSAELSGEDVFLFFDHGSDTKFTGPWIKVDLIGRKTGPYAGMVMATTSGNAPDIVLPGNKVRRLLGVVYAKNGYVRITGSGEAATDSAWTVIVAKQIQTTGTASVRINADYGSSDVPVPNGVGPNAGGLAASGTQLVN